MIPERTKVKVNRGSVWTHPVVSNGKLYLREQDNLYAYDVTQHLLNCTRLRDDPRTLVEHLARLLELDAERVRLWTFARAAHECGEWEGLLPVARALAP